MSELFFFFNDTATTEIYTLSLHDALPILGDPSPATSLGRPRSELQAPRPSGGRCERGARWCGWSPRVTRDRKSTRLNSSHANISYAVFCLKKKKPLMLLYSA